MSKQGVRSKTENEKEEWFVATEGGESDFLSRMPILRIGKRTFTSPLHFTRK